MGATLATLDEVVENNVENATEVAAPVAENATQLTVGITTTGRVVKAQSRTNAATRKGIFLLWLTGQSSPIIVAQSIVSGKGYIDDSQFIGKTITVTPTQLSTSIDARTGLERNGFLADLDMIPAVAGFIELKMNHAARYQVAAQYSVNAEQES